MECCKLHIKRWDHLSQFHNRDGFQLLDKLILTFLLQMTKANVNSKGQKREIYWFMYQEWQDCHRASGTRVMPLAISLSALFFPTEPGWTTAASITGLVFSQLRHILISSWKILGRDLLHLSHFSILFIVARQNEIRISSARVR